MTRPVKPPTLRTGKICYIEIPATDVQQSAEFYKRAFEWQIRQRGDGSTASTTPSARSAARGSSGGPRRPSPDSWFTSWLGALPRRSKRSFLQAVRSWSQSIPTPARLSQRSVTPRVTSSASTSSPAWPKPRRVSHRRPSVDHLRHSIARPPGWSGGHSRPLAH